jgi:hypothetical protein
MSTVDLCTLLDAAADYDPPTKATAVYSPQCVFKQPPSQSMHLGPFPHAPACWHNCSL